MPILVSESSDPFFHLAVEDWLLREYTGELPVWFFYQNRPCVVVGRFQNPWKECDLGWMFEQNLELVRRPSGGGTVWHDLGNVNFCCVGPLKGFQKTAALEVIQGKLKAFGVDVETNPRNDLVVRMADGTTRKVSGSAYKQTKDRSLHHGTLLLSADLEKLERSLNSPVRLKSTKSIASVRSQVLNLSELNSTLTPETWLRSWDATEVITESDPRFESSAWRQWQWRMGETPLFEWDLTVDGHEIELTAHKGMIRQLRWPALGLVSADLDRPLTPSSFEEILKSKGLAFDHDRWCKAIGVGP